MDRSIFWIFIGHHLRDHDHASRPKASMANEHEPLEAQITKIK